MAAATSDKSSWEGVVAAGLGFGYNLQSAALIGKTIRTYIAEYNITATPTGSAQDSGVDLPTKGLVHECIVDCTTAEATGATKTLDVGLLAGESGGDADGFLDGVDVSATGLKLGTFTYTDGTNQNYVSAATLGVLLYDGLLGGDVAGTTGTVVRTPHILNGTAKSLVYTSGSADWAEFRGRLFVLCTEFPT